jgi:hypothetical protein
MSSLELVSSRSSSIQSLKPDLNSFNISRDVATVNFTPPEDVFHDCPNLVRSVSLVLIPGFFDDLGAGLLLKPNIFKSFDGPFGVRILPEIMVSAKN